MPTPSVESGSNYELYSSTPIISLQKIPSQAWKSVVLPASGSLRQGGKQQESSANVVMNAIYRYHYGHQSVSIAHSAEPYQSLLDEFQGFHFPPASDFTLVARKPGTPVTTSVYDSNEEKERQRIADIQKRMSAVIKSHDCLHTDIAHLLPLCGDSLFSVLDGRRRRLPLFASQVSTGRVHFSLLPSEYAIGGRVPITNLCENGTAMRSQHPWPEAPHGVRFLIRLDALGVKDLPRTGLSDDASGIDANGLPNEKVWATVALYSMSEKRRITETFTVQIAPVLSAGSADGLCRSVLFSIPYASDDIYLVIRLWRPFQGTKKQDEAASTYISLGSIRQKMKEDKLGVIPKQLLRQTKIDGLRAANAQTEERYGPEPPLESFAICAQQVFTKTPSGTRFSLGAGGAPQFSEPFATDKEMMSAAPSGKDVDGEAPFDEKIQTQSKQWRVYRINAASNTGFEFDIVSRFKAAMIPCTLDQLSAKGAEEEPLAEDVGSTALSELSSVKPKRIVLGDDISIIRHIDRMSRGKAPGVIKKLVIRGQARLLTSEHHKYNSSKAPIIVPRNLLRFDSTGMSSADWQPPLSWLIAHSGDDRAYRDALDKETIATVHALPLRQPLFTRRELESIGQAGYSMVPVGSTDLQDIISGKVTAAQTINPENIAESTEMLPVKDEQRVMSSEEDTTTPKAAPVTDGNIPLLLPLGETEQHITHSVTRMKSPYWLTPPAPGMASEKVQSSGLGVREITSRAGAPSVISSGRQLGGIEDVIVVAPLALQLKDQKGMNIMVRVEFLNDDAHGVGRWKEAYSYYSTAVTANIAILHYESNDQSTDEASGARIPVTGAPVSGPLSNSEGAVRCIIPSSFQRPLAQADLLSRGLTSVSQSPMGAQWSDEIRISVPALKSGELSPKAHLLFTFFNVSLTSGSAPYTPVGYAFYPLVDKQHPLRVAAARSIGLPVAQFLPPGYLSISGYQNKRGEAVPFIPNLPPTHIPWLTALVDHEKTGRDRCVCQQAFFFNVELESSLRTWSTPVVAIMEAVQKVFALNAATLSQTFSPEVQEILEALDSQPKQVLSVAEFMRNLPHLITLLLQAMVYVNQNQKASEIPEEDGLTDALEHSNRVPLMNQLFRVLMKTVRICSKINSAETDYNTTRRSADLDYYIGAVFDGVYTGPGVQKSSKPQHLFADAICSVWTSEIRALLREKKSQDELTEGERALATVTGSDAWFFLDLIVKDLQLSLSKLKSDLPFDCSKQRPFDAAVYARVTDLVQVLTQMMVTAFSAGSDQAALTPKRLSASISLFLRDLFDVFNSEQAIDTVAGGWHYVMRDAAKRNRNCTDLQLAWTSGWQIIVDHPSFAAHIKICQYTSVTASLSQWQEQELLHNHKLMYLVTDCIQQTLLDHSPGATALLVWLIAKLDADVKLEGEGHSQEHRRAYASLLWGIADFILLNSQEIMAVPKLVVPQKPSLDLSPDVANATATDMGNDDVFQLLLCVVWILSYLPQSLIISWLSDETPANREIILRALNYIVTHSDLRGLLLQVNRPSSSPSIPAAVAATPQSGGTAKGSRRDKGAATQAGASVRSPLTETGSIGSVQSSELAMAFPGQAEELSGNTVGTSLFATISMGTHSFSDFSLLAPTAAREDVSAHMASMTASLVIRMIALFAYTYRPRPQPSHHDEIVIPNGVLPGSDAEPAVLLTLVGRLLDTPLAYNENVTVDAIELLLRLVARFPSVVVCTPLWSFLILVVVQLMDSPSVLVSNLIAHAFVDILRINMRFCNGRAEAALYATGWTPRTKEITDTYTQHIVAMLQDISTRTTVAQTRVAALVAASSLTSRSQRVSALGIQKTSLDAFKYWQPFSDGGGFQTALQTICEAADTLAPEVSESARDITGLLAGIIADYEGIEQLRQHLHLVDISDAADLYVRQTCLYLSVPVISLRWLEDLLSLLLTCATTLTSTRITAARGEGGSSRPQNQVVGLVLPYSETDSATRFVEAGMTALCAIAILAQRMSVPFDRLVDTHSTPHFAGPDGRPFVRLSQTLIPHLARIWPGMQSVIDLASERNEFAESMRRAIVVTESTETSRLDAADLVVADSYSASLTDNLERLLRLLQIASVCFHNEGPFSEMAMIISGELSTLMRRLAARDGILYPSHTTDESSLVVPHPFFNNSESKKFTISQFDAARLTPQQILESSVQPGAGWWTAVEACEKRSADFAQRAISRTPSRSMSNYFLVRVHAKKYFDLTRIRVEKVSSEHSLAGSTNISGIDFIYRQPASVSIDEFESLLTHLWDERVCDLVQSICSLCPAGKSAQELQNQYHMAQQSGAPEELLALSKSKLDEARQAAEQAHEILSVDELIRWSESRGNATQLQATAKSRKSNFVRIHRNMDSIAEEVALSENGLWIVVQLLPLQPLDICNFFKSRGSNDWHCLEALMIESNRENGKTPPMTAEVDQMYVELQGADSPDSDTGFANSPRVPAFQAGFNADRFFYETTMYLAEDIPEDSPLRPLYMASRRTIYRTPLPLPALLPRVKIASSNEVIIKPVRYAINRLKRYSDEVLTSAKKVALGDDVQPALSSRIMQKLADGFSTEDDTQIMGYITFGVRQGGTASRDTSSLHDRLNNVLNQHIHDINSIAFAFTSGEARDELQKLEKDVAPTELDLTELRVVLSHLCRTLRYSLDVDAAYCPIEQQSDHRQLEIAYLRFQGLLKRCHIPIPGNYLAQFAITPPIY